MLSGISKFWTKTKARRMYIPAVPFDRLWLRLPDDTVSRLRAFLGNNWRYHRWSWSCFTSSVQSVEIQETSILRACKSTVFFILEGTVFCNVLVELPGNIDFYTFFSRRNGQILGAPLVLKKEGYSMKDTSIFLTHTARTLRFTFHKVYLIE